MNAGAALFVAGKSEDLVAGWDLARETIDSGRAGQKLKALAKRN
jgi:anthranilate phosphoribosyltransferase